MGTDPLFAVRGRADSSESATPMATDLPYLGVLPPRTGSATIKIERLFGGGQRSPAPWLAQPDQWTRE
jgi:hypothetical protein